MSENLVSKLIIGFSVFVIGLVVMLFYVIQIDIQLPFDTAILPSVHAAINASVFSLLLLSFYFIKNKRIVAHKRCNLLALTLSALFLVSYVTYHATTAPTKYGGEGILKVIYLFVLLTHIVLAAIILPIILFTFWRALQGNFDKHRKLAKWTMPLWLYVSLSGVIVYLMLCPYY